jgi:phosphomethylpyrimidine synthase
VETVFRFSLSHFILEVVHPEAVAFCKEGLAVRGIDASPMMAYIKEFGSAAWAKKIPFARDIDDRMAEARRKIDWEEQWSCAIDSETAKSIRNQRKPEHDDTCSMCGKFCAVRSMNKALSGEYIDIL